MRIRTAQGVEVITLDKVTELRLPPERKWMNLERLPDGKWRLVYTVGFVADIDDLEALEIESQVNSSHDKHD